MIRLVRLLRLVRIARIARSGGPGRRPFLRGRFGRAFCASFGGNFGIPFKPPTNGVAPQPRRSKLFFVFLEDTHFGPPPPPVVAAAVVVDEDDAEDEDDDDDDRDDGDGGDDLHKTHMTIKQSPNPRIGHSAGGSTTWFHVARPIETSITILLEPQIRLGFGLSSYVCLGPVAVFEQRSCSNAEGSLGEVEGTGFSRSRRVLRLF